MRKLLLYITLTLVSLSGIQAQNADFKASAPTTVLQGSRFQLVYSINKEAGDLRLPDITDFQILMGPSTSQSTEVQFINGTVTRNVNYSFTYVLRGDKVGRFTIPPASIEVDGKRISSNSVTIEVVESDSQTQQQQQQSEAPAAGTISDADLYIVSTVNKSEVWQDEPVLLTTKIYTKVNLEGISDVTQPELRNFVVEELPMPNNAIQWDVQSINGVTYRVGTFSQRVIYAQTPGTHTVEPTAIEFLIRQRQSRQSYSIFDDFFSGYRTVKRKVASKPLTIKVKPLPSPRPANFSGIVGDVTLKVTASKTQVSVNDGITLKAEITGTGNHRLARNPVFQVPADFDVFDPNVSNSIVQTSQGGKGTRTVETLIIPRHSGSFEIPPVEYSYFNPSTGRYHTLKSEPITIEVARGTGEEGQSLAGTGSVGSTRESLKLLGKDIRYIKSGEIVLKPMNTFLFGSRLFILAYLVPLILCIAIHIVNIRRIRENADIAKVKNKKANKLAKRRLKKSADLLRKGDKEGFYEEITRALWGYLSDKLDIPRANLTKDIARSTMLNNGADENLADEFLSILDTCEFARYSPTSDHSERDHLYNKSLDTISKLEESLKKRK